MRVLVVGGSGRTGRLIALKARANGHDVTVTARNPESLTAGALPGDVLALRADVHDPDTVRDALRGQDAVVVSVSSPARASGAVYSTAARAVVDAARAGTRAVFISSGGTQPHDPGLPMWYRRLLIPLFMRDLYEDMRAMEAVVRKSALDWTIVRASYLQEAPSRNALRVRDGANPPRRWKLSRSTLAQFVVDQLESAEWSHRTPTLAE